MSPRDVHWLVAPALLLLGCGHVLVAGPPVGTAVRGEAKVLIAQDVGGPKLLCAAYRLTEEHTVVGQEPGGTQHLRARLVAAEAGASQEAAGARPEGQDKSCDPDPGVERMLSVLRDVAISYDRSCRGEVSGMKVEGRAGADELAAAQGLLGYVYHAGLGALLPPCDEKVKKQALWPAGQTRLPALAYRYQGASGPVATIVSEPASAGRVQLELQLDRQLRDLTGSRLRLQLPLAAEAPASGVAVDWKATSRALTNAP